MTQKQKRKNKQTYSFKIKQQLGVATKAGNTSTKEAEAKDVKFSGRFCLTGKIDHPIAPSSLWACTCTNINK